MLNVLDAAGRDLGRLSFTLFVLAVCWALNSPMFVIVGFFTGWTVLHLIAVMDLVKRGERSFFYQSSYKKLRLTRTERLEQIARRKS